MGYMLCALFIIDLYADLPCFIADHIGMTDYDSAVTDMSANPLKYMVGATGFEPVTVRLKVECSTN